MPRFDSARTLGNRKFAETFWNSRLIYLFQFSTNLQSLEQSNKQKFLSKSIQKWVLVLKLKYSLNLKRVFLSFFYAGLIMLWLPIFWLSIITHLSSLWSEHNEEYQAHRCVMETLHIVTSGMEKYTNSPQKVITPPVVGTS